jgi:hypothetical protein
MLEYIGDKTISKNVIDYTNTVRNATLNQWNGKWFRRAWLSEELGWIGDDILWLEPQPWVIIGNIVEEGKIETFINTLDKLVRKPSRIGAILHSKPIDNLYNPPGMATNAGIWPSINGTLIWALSMINGEMAFDEWKKNSLAYKAEQYPEIWYTIWSGPDTLNSIYSKYPGHTLVDQYYFTMNPDDHDKGLISVGINWTDFPVLNLHPHAWPLYNIFHLIGLTFNKHGVEFKPNLPKKTYSLNSPIIGFERLKNGYSGWYLPLLEGTWTILIRLTELELKSIGKILVNGEKSVFKINNDSIIFEGKGGNNKPLSWKIEILF